MQFKKTAAAAAIAALCASAWAEDPRLPITGDYTATGSVDFSVAGSPVVQGATETLVKFNAGDFDVKLTSSNSSAVATNVYFTGTGTLELKNENGTVLDAGNTRIEGFDTVKLVSTDQASDPTRKVITGHGNHYISSKNIELTADDDVIHFGGDATGSVEIRGFDKLTMTANLGHGIQDASKNAAGVKIIGNSGSEVTINTTASSHLPIMLEGQNVHFEMEAGKITLNSSGSDGFSAGLGGTTENSVVKASVRAEELVIHAKKHGIATACTADVDFIASRSIEITAGSSLGGNAIYHSANGTLSLQAPKIILTSTYAPISQSQPGTLILRGSEITLNGGETAIQAGFNKAPQLEITGLPLAQSPEAYGESVVHVNGSISYGSKAEMTLRNATLYLEEDAAFTINALKGENSAVVVSSIPEGTPFSITTNNATDFKLMASGSLNDQYDDPKELAEQLESNLSVGNAEEAPVQVGAEAGTTSDPWVKTAEGEIKPTQNPSMAAVANFSAMTLTQWRGEMNHLVQRLGDVRADGSKIGAWARVYGYQAQTSKTVDVDLTANTIQVGGDVRVTPEWLVGAAFSYTDAKAEFSNGDGNSDGYALAAYASGFFPCGGYVDIVGRIGRLSSDVTADTLSNTGGVLTTDYDNTTLGLSVELGHHWKFSDTFYLEPQAELAYGLVLGDDFTSTTNGVKISQDDFESLVGRLGARLGGVFAEGRGQVYMHASINHDFLGEANATATPHLGTPVAVNSDLGGTWVSYGVGAQFDLEKNVSFYGMLERSNGSDYQEDYRYSVGLRYVF